METTSLIAIAILVVVFVAMILLVVQRMRSQSLRRRFGVDYWRDASQVCAEPPLLEPFEQDRLATGRQA